MDLFRRAAEARIERESPLAHRMRPRTIDEFVGQDHIVGPGRLLRRAIAADQLSSVIFYGPPGTGKTTLARVIANSTRSHFITINAVLSGVAQIREAIAEATDRRAERGERTTLFVDEVHRWNKAQQDALLPHVENGMLILIGATTENPYFEVNKALVSRSRVFQLKPLGPAELCRVAEQALADPERGYGKLDVRMAPDALDHLVDVANGDARSVLNALELAVETTPPGSDGAIVVDLAVAEESIQRRAVLYDKEGDVHYDTISAFIKSLRGSDPDAALYWMAKMVYAGEDPRFVFRRMAILASEDVGLADPGAVHVVQCCWDLFERIGMPEGRFAMAEAALYLATCPKSNSAFAFFDALETVGKEREAEVPNHLKDASRDAKGFGHGAGYLYPHAYRDHWVAQQYLPTALQGRVFYEPTDRGYERQIAVDVARRREAQLAAMLEESSAPSEILTSSPIDRARDQWLERAVASTGRHLGEIRDQIFELAAVERHHLVLDLHAGTGLLSWEAVRRTPEGGVWARCAEGPQAALLRQQAERLPAVERIAVLEVELDGLEESLARRGDDDVRFDAIVGRNPFSLPGAGSPPNWPGLLGLARRRLRAGGSLCVAQTIHGAAQRLHALIGWDGVDAALAARVRQAEEAIYHDSTNALVGWGKAELLAALDAAGLVGARALERQLREPRRIGRAVLERWFALGAPRGRASYADKLVAGGLSLDEIREIEALFARQLTDQEVAWETEIVLLHARRP